MAAVAVAADTEGPARAAAAKVRAAGASSTWTEDDALLAQHTPRGADTHDQFRFYHRPNMATVSGRKRKGVRPATVHVARPLTVSRRSVHLHVSLHMYTEAPARLTEVLYKYWYL